MKPAPLILLVAGLVLLVVFGLVATVSVVLMATSNGRVDADEAGPFIGGGCCCSLVGLAMSVGALVWWLTTRQQKP
jgi:hypothetical protein